MVDLERFPWLLHNIKGIAIKKPYYRFMAMKYVKTPLSALGSLIVGGRYNFIGMFEILYVAPDPQTSVEETITNSPFRFPPKVMLTIEVELQNVLDLGNLQNLAILGIESEKLTLPWRKRQDIDEQEAYTQTIGRLVFESKIFEGLLYPSARVTGKYNLAIFPTLLKSGSSIKVYDPEGVLKETIE